MHVTPESSEFFAPFSNEVSATYGLGGFELADEECYRNSAARHASGFSLDGESKGRCKALLLYEKSTQA